MALVLPPLGTFEPNALPVGWFHAIVTPAGWVNDRLTGDLPDAVSVTFKAAWAINISTIHGNGQGT